MDHKPTIIFDFDGVIADSFDIAFEVNKLSRPTLTLERYQNAFNGNINEVKYEDKVVKKIDFFREYGDRFKHLGIDSKKKDFIQKLSQEFQLFIISSTRSDIIQDYLQSHGILSCFQKILGNEVHTSKVEKFKMLFEKYALEPNNVTFITDTAGDIAEAKKVGVKIIVGILGGYQNEQNLINGNPSIVVKDFSQFYDFVHTTI
ncbi:HAD family hydrolase [Candidatus Uhrbacteria bacterium]|nr:HAD family hydrolase [Candidatus Uhrbacteria bacterium]